MVSQNSISTYRDHVAPYLNKYQAKVFEIIKRYPNGITCFEVAEQLDKERHTISGRFSELVSKDLIILSGETKKIPRSKNPNTNHGIWILTEKGKQTNV